MTNPKQPERSSERPQTRFRTPQQPRTPVESLHAKSTKSRTTASPAGRTPATALKRKSVPPTRSQSTLTQIEFVAQPSHLDDDQIDYIAEGQPAARHQRPNSAQLDNGSESDTDYRPPLRTRENLTRFETNDDHPKRRRKANGMGNRGVDRGQSIRRSQTPKASGIGKGKRKSMERPGAKPDKTLTQMDFVRRYITIDDSDDNDVNMGYIQAPPQDSNAAQDPAIENEKTPKAHVKTVKPESATSTKRNRRLFDEEVDLSTGGPLTSGNTQSTNVQEIQQNSSGLNIPFTPRKSRKLEIPSSQSPESPGIAFITSSQFRCATISPTKGKSLIKEESPATRHINEGSKGTDTTPRPRMTATTTRMSPNQGRASDPEHPIVADLEKRPVSGLNISEEEVPGNQQWHPPRSQRDRTVVYETDAESSASEFEGVGDEEPRLPTVRQSQESPPRPGGNSPRFPSGDSEEVPLPETQLPVDMDFEPHSEGPMSDESAYYHRMQPVTQFPHEPVPDLNTQKLSELFPNEGSTQCPLQRGHASRKFPGPFQQSQTQSESQSQSQELDRTEIVPESSPMREQQNSVDETDSQFQRPQLPDPVVQVESSQPVRRSQQGPGNILSRSQLLTSSVMESIALPNFWMGSQDSVGEPYSLPEQ